MDGSTLQCFLPELEDVPQKDWYHSINSVGYVCEICPGVEKYVQANTTPPHIHKRSFNGSKGKREQNTINGRPALLCANCLFLNDCYCEFCIYPSGASRICATTGACNFTFFRSLSKRPPLKLEEEIERADAILESKNINIQTVEEYKRMNEELQKYGLSMESLDKLASVLPNFKAMGYDAQKIVSFVARIKSLKQTESILKNSCKVLESHASRYKEIIPLCEQIKLMGIGFSELAAFHAAVMKKSDLEKKPYGNAAFASMDGIDTSYKLIDARKQLNETWMQVQMLNFFLAR
jgi:hypothetical protein